MEFRDVEEHALRELRAGDWDLRLERMPSFSDVEVVGVTGSRVTYRVWRWRTDVEKFRSPVERMRHGAVVTPTVEQWHREASDDRWRVWLDVLRSVLEMAPARDNRIGLDGTSCGVYAWLGATSVAVEWRERPAAEREALEQWFEGAWRKLLATVNGHGSGEQPEIERAS